MTDMELKNYKAMKDYLVQIVYWFNHNEIECHSDELRFDLIDLMERIQDLLKEA